MTASHVKIGWWAMRLVPAKLRPHHTIIWAHWRLEYNITTFRVYIELHMSICNAPLSTGIYDQMTYKDWACMIGTETRRKVF